MVAEDIEQRVQGEFCARADGTNPLHPLAQLAVIVTAQVGAIAERNGLTPMQARMLGLLAAGPRRMAELAREVCVEKAALTGLVDRAEVRGLLTREPDPEDRRAIRVVITDAGVAASAAFYAQLDDAMDAVIADLPVRERARFTAQVTRVAQAQFRARSAGGC